MPRVADIGSKRLISLAPDQWVRWVTGRPEATALQVLGEEFEWISRATDALVLARHPDIGEFAVPCEVQTRYEERMPRRLFAYAGLATEKLNLPAYPVLVNLLPPAAGTVIPDYYESELFGRRTRVEYRVINLWEVDVQEVFSAPLPPLLPFVPLFRGGGDAAVVQRAATDLRAEERLSDLEPLLAFFASFILDTELVRQIMRWDMAVLTESPFYRQIIREGELSKARDDVLAVLRIRFGPVPEETDAQVRAISDLDRLTDLHGLAITVTSPEEFARELDRA